MKEYAYGLLSRLNSTGTSDGSSRADALLISDPCNMRYYSGFSGGEGILLITSEDCFLITDSRYTEAAGRESDFLVIEESRSHKRVQILQELAGQYGLERIAYEDEVMTCAALSRLQENMTEIREWIPMGRQAELPRQIKRQDEIDLLAQAEAIGDAAFSDLLGLLKTGMTELEIAAELEYLLKKHGAEGLSFDTIAASGENSSMPHAVPTGKVVEKGDFLTLDFGCRYHGYCSDMTRTVAFGSVSDRQRKIYDTVLEAQLRALDTIRAGITGAEADHSARLVIEEAGYGNCFGHALGHSVGLYIHEEPRLGPGSEDVLAPGMAVTAEPGIYIPGYCGVRIEDLVIVTENGCRSLTASPKDLIII
ncbi:MAG: aminopeptidase P family protein [Eubacterium sp.]|nr:aminopeptidase P family protein [Eubacterium sp.]